MSKFIKDPDATLDWFYDWSEWLQEDEIINDAEVFPNDLILENTFIGETGVTAWLSGGVAGTKYTVTCRITTSVGRVDDRSITISVKER
jgi:hypothetical protein